MNFQLLGVTLILMSGFVGSASALYLDEIPEDELEDAIDEMRGKGVIIRTQEGNFMIELFPEDAPNHVHQFLKLIESGKGGGAARMGCCWKETSSE